MASGEYEDDLADPVIELIQGGPPSDIQSPVADMLLNMASMVTMLGVQLAEADDVEFKAVKPRLEFLKGLVAALPTEPQKRRTRIGFKVSFGARKRRRRS